MEISRKIQDHLNFTFEAEEEADENEIFNKPEISGRSIIFPYPCNDTRNCSPYKVFIDVGYYRFELWGAQGGDGRYVNSPNIREDSGGKGAYVRGNIKITEPKTFFLYIGGRGGDNYQITQLSHGFGGYNGGQDGGADLHDGGADDLDEFGIPESSAGGGGSTDIRLEKGFSREALISRIIIAAGGGGAASTDVAGKDTVDYRGGHGGTLNSSVYNKITYGASQIGYQLWNGSRPLSLGFYDNEFRNISGGSIGGGGGGYFGGSRYTEEECIETKIDICAGGPGGSSYISGYSGCNSVSINNEELVHTNSSIHQSKIIFFNSEMIDGSEIKHSGSGKIKITFLQPLFLTKPNSTNYFHLYLFMSAILITHSHRFKSSKL